MKSTINQWMVALTCSATPHVTVAILTLAVTVIASLVSPEAISVAELGGGYCGG